MTRRAETDEFYAPDCGIKSSVVLSVHPLLIDAGLFTSSLCWLFCLEGMIERESIWSDAPLDLSSIIASYDARTGGSFGACSIASNASAMRRARAVSIAA
jgi:hypothetical protein